MTRRLRFRCSLATLLIAMAWSAVVVWMNVTPRIWGYSITRTVFDFGWPWVCLQSSSQLISRIPFGDSWNLGEPLDSRWYHWSLTGDIAVGLLLVLVLTWGSNQLLRRVGARLRRRSAAKLGKQQALDSQAE